MDNKILKITMQLIAMCMFAICFILCLNKLMKLQEGTFQYIIVLLFAIMSFILVFMLFGFIIVEIFWRK